MADDERPPERTETARRADHAAIARLADDLLPALVAKLGASGLGELEVREGSWKVRIRMPARGGRRGAGRAAGETAPAAALTSSASTPAVPVEGLPTAARGRATPASEAAVAIGPGPIGGGPSAAAGSHRPPAGTTAGGARRAVAASPAVGFFVALPGLSAGARVRAGDRVGFVDVLGVRHDVLSPADGRVGATLVATGEPVEYGQEVVEIELLPNGSSHHGAEGGRLDVAEASSEHASMEPGEASIQAPAREAIA